MREIDFELHAYPCGPNGEMPERADIVDERCRETSARGRAGRLAKRIKGPVDLAYTGNEPWADRYITTAMPCEYTANGFRFERLDN